MRVRKRTKKNRAPRRGAGFSVNPLRGINGIWVACEHHSSTNAKVLDGLTRKNPQLHNRTRGI